MNQPTVGRLRFGQRVYVTDHTVAADEIRIGDESSVFDVLANSLFRGLTATVRGDLGIVSLPLRDPFCELPLFTCDGNAPVAVPTGTSLDLVPGSYGALVVADGAVLNLEPDEEYTFCSARIGREAVVQSVGRATINVVGDISVGAGSRLWTPEDVDDLPLILNVGGTKVRLSQAAIVEAAITAPNAKLKIQRQGEVYGCFCTDRLTTDKEVRLECVATTLP